MGPNDIGINLVSKTLVPNKIGALFVTGGNMTRVNLMPNKALIPRSLAFELPLFALLMFVLLTLFMIPVFAIPGI